jgi:type 1 glutamine amidotransferase
MKRTMLFCLFLVAGLGFCVSGAVGAEHKGVSPDIVAKITKAAPEKATAAPAQKRKVLAFTKALGYVHESIPVCSAMVEILGSKSGAWETVVSDDMAMFEPETLKQFDGVFMCSTTGDLFGGGPTDKMPKKDGERFARLRKSVLDFVAGGKGWGGSHAACDSCYGWPEYGEMLGGYFSGHPYRDIFVKIDDPASPLTAVFKGQGFKYNDEMYVFGPRRNGIQPYSREKLHVLLSIDAKNQQVKIDPKAGGRADADYAISWIKTYGQGRVFYCSFGHEIRIFFDPRLLQLYQDGIQFMLGDLKADTTPSAKAGE